MGKISEKPSLLRSNLKKANTYKDWLVVVVRQVLLACFQNTKGRLQKHSIQFLAKKLKAVEATLDIRGKTQYFLTKIPRIYQKVLGILKKIVDFFRY